MNLIKTLLFVTGIAMTSVSLAQTEARFSNGRIVIPELDVNGKLYYVTLTLSDPDTLSFTADLKSLTNITPPEDIDAINLDDTDILGTWIFDGVSRDDMYLTFNDDGSVEYYENSTEEGCTPGLEEGTYAWNRSTGLLTTTLSLDENGDCGLSHPRDGVPLRVFVDGNRMQIIEKGEHYSPTAHEASRLQ